MAFVSLSSKGQLTLPGEIRRRLGLGKGDMLAIEEINGEIVLKPVAAVPIKMYSDKEINAFLKEDALNEEEKRTIGRDIDLFKKRSSRKR